MCIMVQPLTLALLKCVHLPYFRHASLIPKIDGLLQLIIVSLKSGDTIDHSWSSSGTAEIFLCSIYKPHFFRIVKVKALVTSLLLVLEVCNVKTPYRKSWTRNLLMWSDLTLGPLLQGQTRIAKVKTLVTSLLLVLEVCNVKPTYRKSWARNLQSRSLLLLLLQVYYILGYTIGLQ